jgi:hypothetical protein
MPKKHSAKAKRRVPKTVLRLPDLDQAKSAVLNSLSSIDAQRGYRQRSRSSSNGTARNRGSRSARQSSSGIKSIWSLGIWHLAPLISASAQCAASLTRRPTAVC